MATKKKRPAPKVKRKAPPPRASITNNYVTPINLTKLEELLRGLDERTAAAHEAANRLGQMADALEQTLARTTQRIVDDAPDPVPTLSGIKTQVLAEIRIVLGDKSVGSVERLRALGSVMADLGPG